MQSDLVCIPDASSDMPEGADLFGSNRKCLFLQLYRVAPQKRQLPGYQKQKKWSP